MIERWIATCPKGIEGLLESELIELGAQQVRQTVAGVTFEATLKTAYEIALWTRLANRLLMLLTVCDAYNAEQLYQGVKSIQWDHHMAISSFFRVDFNGTNKSINNTHFGALKVKDAIVDFMKEKFQGQRPSIDKDKPGIRINVFLKHSKAQVALDFSGDSLHKRGYRKSQGLAPLKENLASALLYRTQWKTIYENGGGLLDPMCGSGTLLIEAAFIALDRAPGLKRDYYGFEEWLGHRPDLWQDVLEQAQRRYQSALEKNALNLIGYDQNPQAIDSATKNIQRSGLGKFIKIEKKNLSFLECPQSMKTIGGLLLTNPPYGERISEVSELMSLYREFGSLLRKHFIDWEVGVFTSNLELGKQIGIRARKLYKFYNGALESRLLMFSISEKWFMQGRGDNNQLPTNGMHQSVTSQALSLDSNAQMFANRVLKNRKARLKWSRKENIDCYRLYDADIPEFNVAIDIYHDWVHVQEYKPPASIDEQKAKERLLMIIDVLPSILETQPQKIIVKQRERQKGINQYQRQGSASKEIIVNEGNAKFFVNLTDYLDTGLFLDHRPIRLDIEKMAKGKCFLNLFSYTASASVHAALGGAEKTVSVDLSATYSEWAKKNFALNELELKKNVVIQSDCIKWLKSCDESFDLVFLDPPTFSNSKRMVNTLDIQRDHVDLINLVMKRISDGGVLIFSNNYRRFSMNYQALSEYEIVDISKSSIPKDFERNDKIHRCWKIMKTTKI